jgi:hypothetical protein
MSAVQFHCPLCTGLFQVDDSLAGYEVNCPHCAGLVTVPSFEAEANLPPPAMELGCPMCSGLFQVTADTAGQQVSCPHCGQLVQIPSAEQFSDGYAPDMSAYGHAPFAPPPSPSPQLPPPTDPAWFPPTTNEPSPGWQHPSAPTPTPASAEQPGVTTDDAGLFPPGYIPKREVKPSDKGPAQPSEKKPKEKSPAVDPLLPPMASEASPQLPVGPETLLPRAAAAGETRAERKPLPVNTPSQSSKGQVLIPTEKGLVGVREPVKKIQHRGQEIELRQLTPEEKSRRRLIRNAIFFGGCLLLLMLVVLAFNWQRFVS